MISHYLEISLFPEEALDEKKDDKFLEAKEDAFKHDVRDIFYDKIANDNLEG